jgi:hypothetical protein
MEHDAAPDAFVVAVQLCAVLPEPSVRVSGWPFRGVPLLVSVDDRVTEEPFVAVVAPVYFTVVGAGVITKLLCPLLGSNCGDVLVLPANVPVTG